MKKTLVIIILLLLLVLSSCSSKVYTVTFNTSGGSTIPSVEVKALTTVSEPNVPIKEGYSFLGWYSDSTFNYAYDFSRQVAGNLTLYAKWSNLDPRGLLLAYFEANSDWSCIAYVCQLYDVDQYSMSPSYGFEDGIMEIQRRFSYNGNENRFLIYYGIKERSTNANGDFSGYDTDIDLVINLDDGSVAGTTYGVSAYVKDGYIAPLINETIDFSVNISNDNFVCTPSSSTLPLCNSTKIYFRLFRMELTSILGLYDLTYNNLYE